jgi:hypothetical protein
MSIRRSTHGRPYSCTESTRHLTGPPTSKSPWIKDDDDASNAPLRDADTAQELASEMKQPLAYAHEPVRVPLGETDAEKRTPVPENKNARSSFEAGLFRY